MKGKKKHPSDTKIIHKEANTSKYLHLYLFTQSKNSVSYLLLIDSDARINLKSCRTITMIQDHSFCTPFHGNQIYFLLKKFVILFTLFFLSEKMKGMKKFQSDTKIVHKVANISKYLHLYLYGQNKNSAFSLLFI